MSDYPVFTQKVHTDLSYIACAKKLLAAPEQIYPQFATHNAQTLATIYQLAKPEQYYPGQYEFQCLHGMGEPLYEQVVGSRQDKNWAFHVVFMRLSAAMKLFWPIWYVACSKMAPTLHL